MSYKIDIDGMDTRKIKLGPNKRMKYSIGKTIGGFKSVFSAWAAACEEATDLNMMGYDNVIFGGTRFFEKITLVSRRNHEEITIKISQLES